MTKIIAVLAVAFCQSALAKDFPAQYPGPFEAAYRTVAAQVEKCFVPEKQRGLNKLSASTSFDPILMRARVSLTMSSPFGPGDMLTVHVAPEGESSRVTVSTGAPGYYKRAELIRSLLPQWAAGDSSCELLAK